jgi:hypothetical protein
MKRSSSLAVLAALSLALAAPVHAGTSVQSGKRLCTTAAKAQTPTPVSVRVGDAERATNDTFWFPLRVKGADGATTRMMCTVDRNASKAEIAPATGE